MYELLKIGTSSYKFFKLKHDYAACQPKILDDKTPLKFGVVQVGIIDVLVIRFVEVEYLIV